MSNMCTATCRCNGATYQIWYECTGHVNGRQYMCNAFCKMASDMVGQPVAPGTTQAFYIAGIPALVSNGHTPPANVKNALRKVAPRTDGASLRISGEPCPYLCPDDFAVPQRSALDYSEKDGSYLRAMRTAVASPTSDWGRAISSIIGLIIIAIAIYLWPKDK